MSTLIAVTGFAFLTSVLLTRVVRRLAFMVGMVDAPDGVRKLHRGPIPVGGGVAILLSLASTIAVLLMLPNAWRETLRQQSGYLGGFLLAATVICLVGLLDDRFKLRGRQKLMGQVAAIAILLASGFVIEKFTIFDWRFDLGPLAIPFTAFWMLGAINALNLIDGVDGLATSIGCIFSIALGAMAFTTGHEVDALLALTLAGSLCGFLVYNFPPAKMFLGDCGSMLIGLVLGALAIRSSLKGPATVALAAPTAVWTVLIFDVSMAIVRRKLTGRSLYTTDRGHLHHLLQQRGMSGIRIVVWVGLLCALCSAGALASVCYQNDLLAIVSALAVVGTLVLTRFFGHTEVSLMFHSLRNFLRSLLRFHRRDQVSHDHVTSRLQGNREWESLWKILVDFAEVHDLSMIQLNVNLPALHEEYHAVWKRKHSGEPDHLWHTTMPLMANGQSVGRLRLAGLPPADGSVCTWMIDLMEGLRTFEKRIVETVEAPSRPHTVTPPLPHRRAAEIAGALPR